MNRKLSTAYFANLSLRKITPYIFSMETIFPKSSLLSCDYFSSDKKLIEEATQKRKNLSFDKIKGGETEYIL